MNKTKRINETSEGAMTIDDIVIFTGAINEECDVLFECSCVCLSTVTIHGNLTAQYNFKVIGDLKADKVCISGKLDCAHNIECEDLEVGRSCVVIGRLSAHSINVHDSLICNELGCDTLQSNDQVIVQGTADVTSDVNIERSLICLDGITADGIVNAEHIIAGEYAELDAHAIILSDNSDSNDISNSKTSLPSIANSSFDTLKDYSSPLSIVLEDVSAFIEKCQDSFSSESLDVELEMLRDISGFLPSFAILYKNVVSALDLVKEKEIHDWHPEFIIIAKAYLSMPEWMSKSAIKTNISEELLRYIDRYKHGRFPIQSRSTWSNCIDLLFHLKNDPSFDKHTIESLDACITLLYGKIGVRPRLIGLYLPNA